MKFPKVLLVLTIFPVMIFSQSYYQKILKVKKIKIGVSKDYPPLNFNKKKQSVGIEVEMIKNLSEYLNAVPEILPLGVNEYVNAVETGKVDIVIAGMSRSLERSKKIWFSKPYLIIHPAALVDIRILRKTEFGEDIEEKPVNSLWDLRKNNNIVFAVKNGSIYQNFISEEFSTDNFRKVESNQEGLKLLFDYQVTAFIHDSIYLEYLVQQNPGMEKSFKLLEAETQDELICVGLPFGDTVLKNQIDVWVDELIRTGKIKKWIARYTGNDN